LQFIILVFAQEQMHATVMQQLISDV